MLKRKLEYICMLMRVLLGILITALAIPVIIQIISRYTELVPTLLWTEELARFIFVWVVMIGSIVAVWDGTHFDVRVFPDAKNPFVHLLQNGFVYISLIFFGMIFIWYGIEYAEFGALQNSMMMRANMLVTFISVPVAGFFWVLFAGYRFFEEIGVYLSARSTIK